MFQIISQKMNMSIKKKALNWEKCKRFQDRRELKLHHILQEQQST